MYAQTYFIECFPTGTIISVRYEAAGIIQGQEQIKDGNYCARKTFAQYIELARIAHST